MKFAIAALLATTSTIKIQSSVQGGCLSRGKTDPTFNKFDANHNGSLTFDELGSSLDDLS